jgi:hypothetical protein
MHYAMNYAMNYELSLSPVIVLYMLENIVKKGNC